MKFYLLTNNCDEKRVMLAFFVDPMIGVGRSMGFLEVTEVSLNSHYVHTSLTLFLLPIPSLCSSLALAVSAAGPREGCTSTICFGSF